MKKSEVTTVIYDSKGHVTYMKVKKFRNVDKANIYAYEEALYFYTKCSDSFFLKNEAFGFTVKNRQNHSIFRSVVLIY